VELFYWSAGALGLATADDCLIIISVLRAATRGHIYSTADEWIGGSGLVHKGSNTQMRNLAAVLPRDHPPCTHATSHPVHSRVNECTHACNE